MKIETWMMIQYQMCLEMTTHAIQMTSNDIFAPENGQFEDDPFILGFGLFSGALAVSFSDSTKVIILPSQNSALL